MKDSVFWRLSKLPLKAIKHVEIAGIRKQAHRLKLTKDNLFVNERKIPLSAATCIDEKNYVRVSNDVRLEFKSNKLNLTKRIMTEDDYFNKLASMNRVKAEIVLSQLKLSAEQKNRISERLWKTI